MDWGPDSSTEKGIWLGVEGMRRKIIIKQGVSFWSGEKASSPRENFFF
jgi:hypothetical protein